MTSPPPRAGRGSPSPPTADKGSGMSPRSPACGTAPGTPGPGYDGSIWPHHDGFKWPHWVDNWTVRSGPVKSGSEKEEQIRGGARSRRHSSPADRGGASSSRPSGAGASRHSHRTVRPILSRDERTASGYDLALLTTDLAASPVALVARYAAPWGIEQAFADARNVLASARPAAASSAPSRSPCSCTS